MAETTLCDKAVFEGYDAPTTVTREIDGLNLASYEKPGSKDGDYMVFRTKPRKCGFLTREYHFATAMFVMCGDAIISSALTSSADIEQISKMFADQAKQESDLVMGIMQNWPYGRETKVYDSNGRYLGTRY